MIEISEVPNFVGASEIIYGVDDAGNEFQLGVIFDGQFQEEVQEEPIGWNMCVAEEECITTVSTTNEIAKEEDGGTEAYPIEFDENENDGEIVMSREDFIKTYKHQRKVKKGLKTMKTKDCKRKCKTPAVKKHVKKQTVKKGMRQRNLLWPT